jgi:hypothetical protein
MCRPKFRNSNVLILAVFALVASLSVMADSHVRIVRLSYIEGGVQISRGAGAYEKAIVNLPITEGAKLKTSDGRAEVEFEDGSTLRIVADSTVEFPQLSLRDSGAKVSEVKVTSGTAYVNFTGTKNDEFSIGFDNNRKIALNRASHLRIILGDEDSSVAVFKGLVQVVCPSGTTDVKKNQTISFDLDSNQYKVAKNIQETPYDSWDDQQNEYHTRYAAKSYNSYSPYAYGTTDLSYYGNFFNAPGYGMMWQPYLAGAGWDPFMDGAWAFNSGLGFGWISAYPWGWTPYHYGTWVFLPAYGWAWQPGGVWYTWYSQPVVRNAPKSFVAPHAPASGTSTVVVNRGPASTFAGDKLMVRNNSAGLGVPRGQFGNLAKVSLKAHERGVVSQRVPMQSVPMRSSEPRMGNAGARGGSSSRASQPRPRSEPMPRSSGTSAPSSHVSGGAPPHK